MPKSTKLKISNYSPHLFWDVDTTKLDLNKRKAFLVNRVLDYGVMADWKQLVKDLGLNEIGNIATNLRDLDPRAMSFISLLTDRNIKEFRCYTLQQSNPKHWHF